MRTQSKRTYAAVVIALMVVTTRPAAAQSQSGDGWRETPAAVKASNAALTPAAIPAHEAAPATDVTNAELVSLLQQQSETLKRLAAEVEAQRVVIMRQEEKIKAIEIKATETPSAPAAPAVAAPPPPPPPAILVDTGGVKLRVSGLFQGWYTASDQNVVDTFRLRRAELKFSGDVSPRIKWTVMVDPAKTLGLTTTTSSMGGQTVVTGSSISQSGRLLQDAFVALNWKPTLSVEVGQQKIPLGLEGTSSSGKLDLVHNSAPIGEDVTLNYMRYGSEVHITPGRVEDFYLVQVPVAGSARIRVGETAVLSDRRTGTVSSPTQPLDMVWSDGCEKLVVYIRRDAMQDAVGADGDDAAPAAFGIRLHSFDAAVERALREWELTEEVAAR